MTKNDQKNQDSIQHFHTAIDAAFDDVADGVVDELTGIQAQISQIELLLKDAIASLYEGFEGISEESTVQMKVMSQLMSQAVSSHDDTPNIFQRTESAAKLLKHLVDISIEGSRESLNALKMMEGLHYHMGSVLKKEKKMQGMLQQMDDLLSAETPDIAAIQHVVADMKQDQASNAEVIGKVHEAMLDSYIAIKDLAARDMTDVYQAKSEVEELLEHFHAITDYLSNCRSDISACNGRMRQHLGVAIRALQFEDITNQSLGHTRLHLDRMEGFVVRMTQGLANIDLQDTDGIDGYAEKIKAIHADMMEYRTELALDERNPVSQQNLDEGDVDLF